MARTLAELPKGARSTDFISLGVISKTFPYKHDPNYFKQNWESQSEIS